MVEIYFLVVTEVDGKTVVGNTKRKGRDLRAEMELEVLPLTSSDLRKHYTCNYNKKFSNKQKTSGFSWSQQRTEVRRQTDRLKSGDR